MLLKKDTTLLTSKKNYMKIGEVVINAFNDKQKSAYSYGVAFGTIEKMTIFKPEITQLNFLAMPKFVDFNMDLDSFKLFFKGIQEGVSSVPFEQNVCYTSPPVISIEEVHAIFEKLWKSIKERNGEEFHDAIVLLQGIFGKLKNSDESCHIVRLLASLSLYAVPLVGRIELVINVARNWRAYSKNIKDAKKAIENKEYQNAGKSTGQFLSTLLMWSTS
jgi:hypothetical protein